jgi:hypothetical protein
VAPRRELRRPLLSYVPSASNPEAVASRLSSTTGVDLDFELYDSVGRLLASGATASANKTVAATIQDTTRNGYRVVGRAGAAMDFQINSTRTLRVPKTGSTGSTTSSSTLTTGTVTSLVRRTVNPLTGGVSAVMG